MPPFLSFYMFLTSLMYILRPTMDLHIAVEVGDYNYDDEETQPEYEYVQQNTNVGILVKVVKDKSGDKDVDNNV